MGFIHEYADMFHLEAHKDAIVEMEGFGQKSYDNLIASVKKASQTTLPRVIYGLGIAGIGLANAKMLCRHFRYDFKAMRNSGLEELTAVDGIGEVLARAWMDYFADKKNNDMVDRLLEELSIEEEPVQEGEKPFEGLTFCNYRIGGAFCQPQGAPGADRKQGRQSIRLRNLQNRISHQ